MRAPSGVVAWFFSAEETWIRSRDYQAFFSPHFFFYRKYSHQVLQKTTLYFGWKCHLILSTWLALYWVSQKTTLYFGSKCELIFSTFIGNVDIFPHCPHYEGLVAIFRPRVTFINGCWLFDLVLFTSSIMIQDHYFHHLHCTYFSTSSEAVL